MSKIDRLLNKAKPKRTICERLAENNPYFKYTRSELLDFMTYGNYRAPKKGTWEWQQFMYAMCHTPMGNGGGGLKDDD